MTPVLIERLGAMVNHLAGLMHRYSLGVPPQFSIAIKPLLSPRESITPGFGCVLLYRQTSS